MKKLHLLSLLLLLSLGVMAQSKDEKAVAAAIETLKKAMIDGDRTALTDIADEHLTYGHSSGKVENKTEFVESIASGKSDFVKIDLTEQTISVDKDVALVRHTLNADIKDGGVPNTIKLKILLVFHKEKGQWKLVARQAVKLP
jgi:ketosteroid isomerase-like protein